MNQEIFADGVSAIHVTGNLVRIDLMTVQPHLKSDNSRPVVEIGKREVVCGGVEYHRGCFEKGNR